ncbi:UNVERIFIED_CONTAM: hypothetical protein K2H54_066585 [Gekko kuhli]
MTPDPPRKRKEAIFFCASRHTRSGSLAEEMDINTPIRPLILSTPPPVVRPDYKRQYITCVEDEEFVPSKLYFPTHDEEAQLTLDYESMLQPSEVSQVWYGLLEDLPDSWKLIPAEDPQSTAPASTAKVSAEEEEEEENSQT